MTDRQAKRLSVTVIRAHLLVNGVGCPTCDGNGYTASYTDDCGEPVWFKCDDCDGSGLAPPFLVA